MGTFLVRSEYLKKVASYNKAIANNVEVDGEIRNSYHRLNDEEELLSAANNWGHFPCMVHIGYNGKFGDNQTETPKNRLYTHLYFLDILDNDTFENKADAIESAYDKSFEVMMECLSFMREDREVNGVTSNFYNFDLNNASYDRLSTINGKLYGWYLIFFDSKPESSLRFNPSKFYKGVNDETL